MATPPLGASSFPRQYARTQRFTLGLPRNITVAADGSRVAFCRSPAGDDPVNQLWVFDVDAAAERLVVDPVDLAPADGGLPAAEQARRERAREAAGGIVSYDADLNLVMATFALGGRLYLADLVSGTTEMLESAPDAHDPRLSPDCTAVAYVSGPDLRVTSIEGGDRLVAADPSAEISWGSAEFVAAEEMGRTRGHWWAPDGSRLLAARVDVGAVSSWWISDPANPHAPPRMVRYPEAGGINAAVSLAMIELSTGAQVEIDWASTGFEYLADAEWAPRPDPSLVVVSRDQQTLAVLTVDSESGRCTEVHRQTDPAWVELVPGAPRWVDESLLTVADGPSARIAKLDGVPVTPPDLQVLRVVSADAEGLIVVATTDATETHVYSIGYDGVIAAVTERPGVHGAAAAGGLIAVTASSLDDATVTTIYRDRVAIGTLASNGATPPDLPAISLLRAGTHELNTAVLLPSQDEGDDALPVLLDPYGGPHALRVQKSRSQFLVSQWFADQGFAVVIADGRGTPARGPSWEKAVRGDLAGPPLDDQVSALQAAAAQNPRLDLSRVAIRGWSFGGYLAALAVLRRPDVFHAAVAGAPVTDWRLYDTFYTERYLGHPDQAPLAYERTSLIADAAELTRPLLLIHGFADDNVVAAHTLRLSRALLEAGRPHSVLPLSGVSHMTPQESVAENLLLLQSTFLRDALGLS